MDRYERQEYRYRKYGKEILLIVLVAIGLFFAGHLLAQIAQIEVSETFKYFGDRKLEPVPAADENRDSDGDWIDDKVETEIGTDPTKIDTDGDGIDDFNEYYTYPHLLNPNNPADAEKFLAMVPNVKTAIAISEKSTFSMIHRILNLRNSEKGSNATIVDAYIEISKRDPLMKWWAEHVQINFSANTGSPHEGTGLLEIVINGTREPYYWPYGVKEENISFLQLPSFYLTHNGSGGTCAPMAVTTGAILEIKGYKTIIVAKSSGMGFDGHAWLEAEINGNIYVVDGNTLTLREKWYPANPFYAKARDESSYNPNWYI